MQTATDLLVNREALHEEIRTEIEGRFHQDNFSFTYFETAEVLHVFSAGVCGWVAVIGNRDEGSYEWIVRHDSGFREGATPRYESSNAGYGCSASALRDGLKLALGDG